MLPLKWQEGRQPRGLLCFSAAFFVMALTVTLLFVRVESVLSVVLLSAAVGCLYAAVVLAVVWELYERFLLLFLGLLIGWIWCSGYLLAFWNPAMQWDGETGVVRVEVDSYAEGYVSYGIVYGRATHVDGNRCGSKVKVYLQDGSPDYLPGDILVFEGAFHAAQRDLDRNLLQRGYYLTLTQTGDAQAISGAGMNVLRRATILSHHIAETAAALLPGDEGALLGALLSGRRDGFSDGFDRALTSSGTRHITAVSGLHVMTLAGILLWVFGKRMGLLAAVPVAVVYAAVTGFSPSVVRATILLIFWSASFWLKQEKDSLTALAAALLVLLAWNPFSCVSAGLLLSFSATLGLILLSAPIYEVFSKPVKRLKHPLMGKVVHYFLATTAASLAATAFTMPLNLLFFDTVPLVGVVSNLLILWALSAILTLGVLVLLTACLWMPAAQFIASWVLYWPLTWVVRIIRVIGSWPFAATDSANLFLAVACFVVLLAALLWRGKLLSGKKLLATCAALLCAVTVFTTAERMVFGLVEIHNFGGQPVFLLRGEGVSLINTGAQAGRSADVVGTAMSRWNVSELETILCTTDNYRSQGGLPAALEITSARRLLVPSADGTVSAVCAGMNTGVYSASGIVTVSGVTAQLLQGRAATYALRLVKERFSLLSLCGLKAADALAVTEQYPCEAGILVVDDDLTNDWQTFYDLCQRVKPEQILVITGGYSGLSERFGDIPVTVLKEEGLRFRFVR